MNIVNVTEDRLERGAHIQNKGDWKHTHQTTLTRKTILNQQATFNTRNNINTPSNINKPNNYNTSGNINNRKKRGHRRIHVIATKVGQHS